MTTTDLADLIRNCRKSRRMSQQRVAGKTARSQQLLSRMEMGECLDNAASFCSFVEATGYDLVVRLRRKVVDEVDDSP
jgi:transcriptional regulator with XRE-family HTH domain